MDIMPLAPMKKCCEIKPVKLAILLTVVMFKNLCRFTRILFIWAPRGCFPAPVLVEVSLELVCVCLDHTLIHFRRCFFSDLAQRQIYDPECKDLTLSVD